MARRQLFLGCTPSWLISPQPQPVAPLRDYLWQLAVLAMSTPLRSTLFEEFTLTPNNVIILFPFFLWLTLCPAPSLLHAGVFSHRSHQCLQVLAMRFVRSSSLSSRCGQPTSFADPPHRMLPTYLCSPCMLLMLSLYTHVKVFRCLRRACPYFHFLLGARDQPTSLV